MMFKLLLLAVALTAVAAQHHHHQGHGHGHDHGHSHAYSSQSIVLHHDQKHAPAHHESGHHGQQDQHYGHQEYHGHSGNLGHSGHLGHSGQLGHSGYHGHASSSQNIHQYHDGHLTKHIEYYGHPKYEFAYEVKDPHTHDFKNQHEHRDGDVVKGEYSLHQPDGTVRIVKYYADKKSGFHADVKYEGHSKHIVPEHHHHHH